MTNNTKKYLFLISACFFLITSCKHSGSSGPSPDKSITPATKSNTNALPISITSNNQTVKSNAVITVNGTNSYDPEKVALRYSWVLVTKPKTSTAKLLSAKSNNEIVSFTPDIIGDYILELTVNDGVQDSKPDTVTITRLNNKPIASAGKNRAVSTNSQVLLDASASTDIDNHSLTYNWILQSKPLGSISMVVQNNPADKSASFNADKQGEYIFDLTVNDGLETSLKDTVKIYSYNATIIYFNDFSDNSLSDFIVRERGTGKLLVENGQLRINPGRNYLNSAGIVLDAAAKLTNYNSQLSGNIGLITWAFNISNMDGKFNNNFKFIISSQSKLSEPTTFGYSFQGGGYVADRMMFSRIAYALSPYQSVSETIFDTRYGLPVLPKMGAIKITFNPVNNEWKLYYEVATKKLDPVLIKKLIGTGINKGFVTQNLPYFILSSSTTGAAFFDNFTVLIKTTP